MTAVVLCIRHPDDANVYVTEGEVRIIDMDLGNGFDAGHLGDDDTSAVEEACASWLAQVRDLPWGSKVRNAVMERCADLLAAVGSSVLEVADDCTLRAIYDGGVQS